MEKSIKELIERSIYTDKILSYIDKPIIKVLAGARRTGKSSIMQLVMQKLLQKRVSPKNIIYINKEYVKFDNIKNYKDLYDYVTVKLKGTIGGKYIFIDEVQQIHEWQKAVVDFYSRKMGDIIISGSNSTLLSGELATLLAGRYVTVMVYPLNFFEFIKFNKKNIPNATSEDFFELYLRYGGLPAIANFINNDRLVNDYHKDVLNTILYKDVITRFQISKVQSFDLVTKFLFENIGNIISARNIVRYFKSQRVKIAVETVLNYIKYLKSAFIINTVDRYDIKGKKLLELYEKLYVVDLGLRNGLIGYNSADINKFLENIVYNELLVRGYDVKIGSLDSNEIDFVVEKDNERMYIQIAYLLNSKGVINREFGNLERIKDNYPKMVLSMDRFYIGSHNGIKHKYIIDFLLERYQG